MERDREGALSRTSDQRDMKRETGVQRKTGYRPHPSLFGCILALLVNLPSLNIGLIGDDYIHREFIVRHLRANDLSWSSDFWDMFNTHVPVEQRIAVGALPWWTAPDLKVALFRPLGTLSHYLDYWLWGESPACMHAHNILLYLLITYLVSQIYIRVLPWRTAWIATLLYAADDANTLGVAWIASRNTLLTALFSMLTLLEFMRFRSEGRRVHALIAWLGLLLAHASSEGALATWAYLAAYALFVDRAPARSRVIALAPFALLSGSWVALTAALGFGVQGSGAYLDPRTQPLLFLDALSTRLPQLIQIQFGITPELAGALAPATVAVLFGLVLSSILAVVTFLLMRWKTDRGLAFMACGSIGSLLPVCAVGAVGRLLFVSGLGGHALVGALVAALWSRMARLDKSSWRHMRLAAATGVLLTQVAIDGIGARFAAAWWERMHKGFYEIARSLPKEADAAGALVMILNARDYLTTPFVQLYYAAFVTPQAPIVHVLGVSTEAVKVERIDPFSLRLTPDSGYLADPTSILVRPRNLPFHEGQKVNLFGSQVQVERIAHDGRPASIRIGTFGLDDPKLLWVAWNDAQSRYERVELPRIGQSITLPPMPAGAQAFPVR